MKKAKIWTIGIGLAIIGLLIFQNSNIFLANHHLKINLLFFEYHTPEFPLAIFFLMFFVMGALIMYFLNLTDRYRANKAIKGLNCTCDEQIEKIKILEDKISVFKTYSPSKEDQS